ncbi:MAG: methyltransferase [Myxococcales bacterium]|nr:methyltransferase [Myxococcales bacterium]
MTIADEREARREALERRMGEPVTRDSLTGSWDILQRKHGHRHSTDDVLTAYYALCHGPATDASLDLGTGIGTVGLLTLWGLGEHARLWCVEAQDVSFALLRENIALNGLDARVHPTHGDLRTTTFERTFDLVTGSPPYFDTSAGVLPADSQKAHARFELRGTVRDYALAAQRALSDRDEARFVFCFPTPQKARALAAVREADFTAVAHRDVIPREGLPALFSLFACKRGAHDAIEEAPLIVRDASGAHTAELRAVRRRFGFAASEP